MNSSAFSRYLLNNPLGDHSREVANYSPAALARHLDWSLSTASISSVGESSESEQEVYFNFKGAGYLQDITFQSDEAEDDKIDHSNLQEEEDSNFSVDSTDDLEHQSTSGGEDSEESRACQNSESEVSDAELDLDNMAFRRMQQSIAASHAQDAMQVFSGDNSENAAEFVSRLNNHFTMHAVEDDATKIAICVSFLKHEAALWAKFQLLQYGGEGENVREKTWDNFSGDLLNHYKNEETELMNSHLLSSRFQGENEAVADYVKAIADLASKLELTPKETQREFFKGLLPPLQAYVMERAPRSLAECIRLAKLAEKTQNMRQQYAHKGKGVKAIMESANSAASDNIQTLYAVVQDMQKPVIECIQELTREFRGGQQTQQMHQQFPQQTQPMGHQMTYQIQQQGQYPTSQQMSYRAPQSMNSQAPQQVNH